MISHAILAGLLLGFGLIIPIGAQNAYVLKLGLLKQHILPIALLCAAMDAILIVLGVAFAGAAFASNPTALNIVRYVGVAFLFYYGARAFYTAYHHTRSRTPPHR